MAFSPKTSRRHPFKASQSASSLIAIASKSATVAIRRGATSNSSETVSYTHLDVYKRQLAQIAMWRNNYNLHVLQNFSMNQAQAIELCEWVMQQPKRAVSYTHLDVYKRQI